MPSTNWKHRRHTCPGNVLRSNLTLDCVPALPDSQLLAIPRAAEMCVKPFTCPRLPLNPIFLPIFIPVSLVWFECASLSPGMLKCTFHIQHASCTWWHFFNTFDPPSVGHLESKLSTRTWIRIERQRVWSVKRQGNPSKAEGMPHRAHWAAPAARVQNVCTAPLFHTDLRKIYSHGTLHCWHGQREVATWKTHV